ncbi:NAD-dependent dehydratase [Solitalea longa]|uniref:NAD-dependent dehydratase n=1 Tax=Solitalea longa TaxID=2079460 RepID=A0A2S5A6P2_9SPHI|nr:NAD(P)H-binding protein [Solitalea longa]POY37979.1 NAD-dependent dehydratase [Solitalea longa]
MTLQTILGAGGAIGTELARELKSYTNQIRLVSRNPQKVNDTDQLFPADLTDAQQVDKAIEGSSIVYLVVGLEYKVDVWREKWPALMSNVIKACEKHNSRLVFFDNIYMYDREFLYDMTEETPVRPTSKKGEVRAQIAGMLLDEVKAGRLNALIARSADFMGTKNSVPYEMVYKNLKSGKSAYWFANSNIVHSFTAVADAAKGTEMLGNTLTAFNQAWHLPTSSNQLTGTQWVELFAKELNVKAKVSVMPGWMLGILGFFMPKMKEFKEMQYQYDRPYVFNSSKFEKYFNYKPATPEEAVKAVVRAAETAAV